MLISVAIPAFNEAEYLRAALAGVMAQTYPAFEIIVVDDGSTDHTRDVCRSFGDAVTYLHQENDGTFGGGARERAMRAATGDWIALLDQDDRWLPAKLEAQVRAVREQPNAGLSFTGYGLIDEQGTGLAGSYPPPATTEAFHLLLRSNPYCASSALIRRSAMDQCGLPARGSSPADYDLWLRVAREFPVATVAESLTEYRVHGESYSANMMRLAQETVELLERQRPRLHPDCADCTAALATGLHHFSELAADAYLNQYHVDARAGRMSPAWTALLQAARLSPATVMGPRRGLAVVKNGLLGIARGQRRSTD